MKKLYTLTCAALLLLLAACSNTPKDVKHVAVLPTIYPDYTDVTVPADIAPLNFNYAGTDQAECVDVVVKGTSGSIHSNGDWAKFDVDEWHELTEANKGKDLTVTVTVKTEAGWTQYKDFKIHVSPYDLDEFGLTYRRIAPGYQVYSKMGIYERNLSNFEETAIFENTQVPGACVNCHTGNQTSGDDFLFHVRGAHGATVVHHQGQDLVLNTKTDKTLGFCVYPYWHPSGKYVAFSTNTTRQSFHVVYNERIEVFDQASDLQVYNADNQELLITDLLKKEDVWETFPAFSPDGKTLYFCSTPARSIPQEYKEVRYSLCKIAFDPAKGTFGEKVDTVLTIPGKSITLPRPSYDGKYLMYTLSDYGTFPIWHKEAELGLLNLKTGENRLLKEINSKDTESFHNWNTNSHWIVFASRRDGGLYTRLYLASMDDKGQMTKPFLLPQENPWEYYDELLDSYNTPDFLKNKIDFDAKNVGREIESDRRVDLKAIQK